MIDLRRGTFFYPANYCALASAVRELCSPHTYKMDFEPHSEIAVEITDRSGMHTADPHDELETVYEESPDAPVIDLVDPLEEVLNTASAEDLALIDWLDNFKPQGQYVARLKRSLELQVSRELKQLTEFENDRPLFDEDGVLEAMAFMVKNADEMRDETEAVMITKNPLFNYEQDFSFSLEDVPQSISKEYELLSIKQAAEQFQAITEEIDVAFHPEKREQVRRSHGLTGMIDPGPVDSDSFLSQ